jgi:PAS domain S-box-containing protein
VAQWKASSERQDGAQREGVAARLVDSLMEELRVAEEELRVQNEELSSSVMALQAQRRLYQHLFHVMPVAYLVTDSLGAIRMANRTASVMLGLSWEALSGKPLAIFLPLEERAEFRSALSAIAQRNEGGEWPLTIQPRGRAPIQAVATVHVDAAPESSSRWLYWVLTLDRWRDDPDLL